MSIVEDARVTVALVPRERFALTPKVLDALFFHTQVPFRLLVIDGGSPRRFAEELEVLAREHQFRLIRASGYLSPNQARNLAAGYVETEYVVFIDNDVVVTAGWLEALMACADETGAAIVTPLTCQGPELHREIHCAGGKLFIEKRRTSFGRESRHLVEEMYHQGERVDDTREKLVRQRTGLAEFHCVLVRASVLKDLGGFDEGFLSTKEHLDFCLSAKDRGQEIWFEPASLVTYLLGVPLATDELRYFMLRWSDSWDRKSLKHFRRKWRLSGDWYFLRRALVRGWRRRKAIYWPLTAAFGLKKDNLPVNGVFYVLDRVLNAYLGWSYRSLSAGITPPVEPIRGVSRVFGMRKTAAAQGRATDR
jgi:GT2 family glycosyltransferase